MGGVATLVCFLGFYYGLVSVVFKEGMVILEGKLRRRGWVLVVNVCWMELRGVGILGWKCELEGLGYI